MSTVETVVASTGQHRAAGPRARLQAVPGAQTALIGTAAGGAALIDPLPAGLKAALLLSFILLGPGNGLLMWWRGLSRFARVGLPPALGLAILALATAAEAFTKLWSPTGLLLTLGGAVVVGTAARLALNQHRLDERHIAEGRESVSFRGASTSTGEILMPGGGRARWLLPALVIATLASWASALPRIGTEPASTFGLLAAAPIGYPIAVFLAAVTGIVAVRRRSHTYVLMAAGLFVVLERLTVSLANAQVVYPWAFKHIGVVDFIDRFHFVARGTDIYHNWPGLFSSVAWLSQLSSVGPFTIAHYFTPLYHVLLLVIFYCAVRAWHRPPLVAAAATMVFEACSYVAQDYFSPQAFGYILGIAVLLILGESRDRRTAAVPALLLFAAITVSHQLTPYWIIAVTGALVILRRTKPWWLPVAFAAIAGAYLLWNYSAVKQYGVVASVDPSANIQIRKIAQPLFGIRTQFFATVLLYALLFGGAGLFILWALRRKKEWRVPLALCFSPFALILVQGYGGEAIFRVMLFALPALAVVGATALCHAEAKSAGTKWLASVLTLVVFAAAAHALLAPMSAYRTTVAEVDAWRAYNRLAPVPSRILSVGPGFPGNPQWNYVSRYTKDTLYSSSVFSVSTEVATDFASNEAYQELMTLIEATRTPGRPIYLVLTPQVQTYGYLFGVLKAGTTRNLQRHMSTDPRWRAVYRKGGTSLFVLVS